MIRPALECIQFCEAVYNEAQITAGPYSRDGASVIPDGKDIHIAIRGTQVNGWRSLSTIADWVNDFDDLHVTIAGVPGTVHKGFGLSAVDLLPKILQILSPLIPFQDGAYHLDGYLYIEGHSKGGSVGQIIAALLARHFPGILERMVVYNFAAARVGSEEFVANYPIDQCVRFEHTRDIVPTLPPFGFHGAGHPIYDYSMTVDMRALYIGRLVAQCDFQQLHYNHGLDNYRTWMSHSVLPLA